MNLADSLAESAARRAGHTAIVFRGASISFGELDAEAERVASGLAGLGAEPGDRVGIWLPNHPAFASSLYGAWRAGAIVVPVNPVLTWREAQYIVQDSGARVLICGDAQYAELGGEPPELQHVIVLGGSPRDPHVAFESLRGGAGPAGVELSTDHLALLGYTSGTTGLPKGAMLTHGNLRANVEQMLQMPIAPGPDDVALGILPLSHIFGLNVLLNLSVLVGMTIVLEERFEPSAALQAIRDHRVTRLASAPPAYAAWLHSGEPTRADFESVKVATSGAAPLPAHAHRAFAERFGIAIYEGYGLTETSPTLTSTAMGGIPKPGSVGRPVPGVELRLLDGEGDEVEPGDPGEVVVRGPNVFRGYWQHPEETAQVLRAGWFRTGDIAVVDDDGDLFLVDRTRDLILVSGFNVYPKEVEDVLALHPKVREAAAVGAPDALHGEHVRALIVLESGAQATEGEVLEWCRSRLAPFKTPAVVEFVDEIPRNAAGKVLRREIR